MPASGHAGNCFTACELASSGLIGVLDLVINRRTMFHSNVLASVETLGSPAIARFVGHAVSVAPL
jgi:hypothetical protein